MDRNYKSLLVTALHAPPLCLERGVRRSRLISKKSLPIPSILKRFPAFRSSFSQTRFPVSVQTWKRNSGRAVGTMMAPRQRERNSQLPTDRFRDSRGSLHLIAGHSSTPERRRCTNSMGIYHSSSTPYACLLYNGWTRIAARREIMAF